MYTPATPRRAPGASGTGGAPKTGPPGPQIAGKELKYEALAATIRREIRAGVWAVGAKIPTEKQFIDSTGMSLTTVRRALQVLTDEGWLRRQRGAGSFVAPWVQKRERSAYLIGVMVPETRKYYDRVIQGVQDQLVSTRAGSTLLATYEWDPDRETEALRTLLEAGVDGLILTPTIPGDDRAEALISQLRNLPVPVVLAERQGDWAAVGQVMEHVVSDHAGGAFDAVRHLQGLGHTRIGLAYRTGTNTTKGVLEGYRNACRDLGLEGWEWELSEPPPGSSVSSDEVVSLATALLKDGITAVLAFGDREAMSLQNELRRLGTRIPEDIAMVSYDDETADIAAVPLTAVAPPKYQLGKLTADVMIRRLQGGESSALEQIRLRPVLVIRESCGAAQGAISQQPQS